MQAVLHRFPGQGWVTGRKHSLERGNVSQIIPLPSRGQSWCDPNRAELQPVLQASWTPVNTAFFSANPSTPSPSKINKKILKAKTKLHKLNPLMSGFILKLVLGPVNCTLPQKPRYEKKKIKATNQG